MPGSNSEDDDDDIRNYKKRRYPGMQGQKGGPHQQSPPPSSSPGAQPEVMDLVRSTQKLKQQQKALIESRQHGQPTPPPPPPPPSQQQQQQQQSSNGKSTSSNGANAPVTETSSSGLSVFHGSSSFASLSRRPQPSPKNPKNQKSLTIFAPSYSESSLSIHSAPLQPSQSHQAMSMGLRTSQPLLQRNHQHPYAPQSSAFQQPLRSPRALGHVKKTSRTAPRQSGAGADSSSGTIPAPILSSHTGPLPSPSLYPSTPFLPNPKHMFMETVSSLFDSVDSSRSLKYTLEEQIRKSAQLLQTLKTSGTMIENLVRGQFKELERGVIDRFESDIEYLNARVRQLEEHQGLTPPPRKPKASIAPAQSASSPTSSSAMTGITSTSNGTTDGAAPLDIAETENESTTSTTLPQNNSSPNSGTLPTPPLTKNQDTTASAMEVEDDDDDDDVGEKVRESSEVAAGSSLKCLQERVAKLEDQKE
ncbi:hypothetical protein BGZ65_003545 [Modicella reniformis]|uniref:Uncharacterized protein n=1 Tax=Modicella reniformis TaxID=1440133 RepID=A0A9P6M991_9FUNG|nr:hypothetical protein BGZ65_003545 [Modicella reniformis]